MVEARSEPSPIPAQRKKFTPAKNKPPVIDQSQAKTDAETMDLHRMPLLAARGPDAAPVKRIGSSACREVGGLGDRGSHGFGARRWRAAWLRRCADSYRAACPCERGLGAGRDRIALVLGNSGKDAAVHLADDTRQSWRSA